MKSARSDFLFARRVESDGARVMTEVVKMSKMILVKNRSLVKFC